MNVTACLPPPLQGPTTVITPIAAGLSGPGVYRVEAGGQPFVLKISVFFRMDEASCLQLITAHDGIAPAGLPARFSYDRRLIAALCGAMFLQLARQAGHAGATTETFDTAPSLLVAYQRMRTGEWSVATPDGRWRFGLALLKDSFAM